MTTSNDLAFLIPEYERVLKSLLDKHAPVIKRTIRSRPNASWFNDNLHKMKRELRRLERKWIASKLEVNKQCFKQMSDGYNIALKQAKLDYHKEQLENCNSKQLFQKVEQLSKASPF